MANLPVSPSSPSPDLRCSECGAAIPTSADLSATLSDEEIANLPRHLTTRARILCASCAATAASPTPADTPQSPRSRYYRLVLTIQEQADTSQDPTIPDTEWETIGNFILRGGGQSVAEFVESQSDEFAKRMQVILDFGDAETK